MEETSPKSSADPLMVAALDRTLRLMRDDLRTSVTDEELLGALRSTSILLSADEINASTHSAQSALVTVALLAARSGINVWIDLPDVDLVGVQPPLKRQTLASGLLEVGDDLVPGVRICRGRPANADLVLLAGNTPARFSDSRVIRFNASDWAGWIGDRSDPWMGCEWPLGGLAAASAAAAEAIKAAMRKLSPLAWSPENFALNYAAADEARIDLATESSAKASDIGRVDLVSAGAIINAALYALLRIPNVSGSLRITEPRQYHITNLNRCMLLRRTRVGEPKAMDLASFAASQLPILPVTKTFQEARCDELRALAERVLVGVDHIPTRWDVQAAAQGWIGIGGTTHWQAMASYHVPGIPCGRCAHPRNEDTTAVVPTISLVSFCAGLWLASLCLLDIAGQVPANQYYYIAPLSFARPAAIWSGPIAWNRKCPSHGRLAC
jgi:hypothetical protein